MGILFANGRRTVTTWLRAAGSQRRLPGLLLLPRRPRTQDQIGRHATGDSDPAARCRCPSGLLLVIDDSPTKRYGPKVEGADIHRNPTPGPVRPNVSVRPHLGDALLGRAASLVGRHRPAAASDAVRSPADDGDDSPERRWTVCHQAAAGGPIGRVDRAVAETSGKKRLGRRRRRLHQRPFLEASAEASGVVVVGRIRKDAALRIRCPSLGPGNSAVEADHASTARTKISLAKRAGQTAWLANDRVHGLRTRQSPRPTRRSWRPTSRSAE